MKFVHPEILWALTALSIPILVHLFNFRKFNEPPHTTSEFYRIGRVLGRGAFGVVLRCVDHAHPQKEHVALKILKNKKKLHK
jgi:serine/threonine protein kinase